METVEEIIDAFSALVPLWNDDVWAALQEQNFNDAESYLQYVLSQMSSEEWASVYWMGILNGVPAFRGELDMATWDNKALPCIGRAIIKSASAQKISATYFSIDPDELKIFHNFLVNTIPGKNSEEKVVWIKKVDQSPLIGFFAANPLGLHLNSSDSLTEKNIARLKTIPENIKLALFSIQTPEIIKGIIEQNSIPEEKTSRIADVIGLVFLGFMHTEDLSHEIEMQAGIPNQTAVNLTGLLNKKLFATIKPDLDKIYAPLPRENEIDAPKIIQETILPQPAGKIPMPAPAPKAPAPQIISQSFSASLNVSALPLASNKNTPGAAPQPNNKPGSDRGWSTRTPQSPVVTLGTITPAIPSPTPSSSAGAAGAGNTNPAASAKPTMPSQPKPGAARGMSEFERLDMSKKNSAPTGMMPGAPTPVVPIPKPPTAPAPVMLHQVSATSAQSPEFRVNMGMQNQMGGNAPRASMPSKPAVLEFGDSTGKPPTPTTPPSPNKVIVQDFLG